MLGVLPGIIGTIQATEAVKLILGIGEPLVGRFLLYDALRMQFRVIRLPKDPDCPVCGSHPTIRELRAYDDSSRCAPAARPKGHRWQRVEPTEGDMTVTELKARIDTRRRAVDRRRPGAGGIRNLPDPRRRAHPFTASCRRTARELDASKEIVLQCKVGARSASATAFLRRAGFARARNLTGGILAWIDQVDPSQPKY